MTTHCPYCSTDTSAGKPVFVHPELGYRYCSVKCAREHNGLAEFYGFEGEPERAKYRFNEVPEEWLGLVVPWSDWVPPKCLQCGSVDVGEDDSFCGNDCEISYYRDRYFEAIEALRDMLGNCDMNDARKRAEWVLAQYDRKDA